MKKNKNITPEDFENLLNWLSPDREQAGEIYEDLRRGLIRFYRYRGCSECDLLADETFNRVARKVSEFRTDKEEKTIGYIYGFAKKIAAEYHNKRKKLEFAESFRAFGKEIEESADFSDLQIKCLRECLARMSNEESQLILNYYQETGGLKKELRKKMAEQFDLTLAGLHTKVHRLKKTLRSCIDKCCRRNS